VYHYNGAGEKHGGWQKLLSQLRNYFKDTVNAQNLSKSLQLVVMSSENTVLLKSNSHEQSF
jgi:hypothetical protein